MVRKTTNGFKQEEYFAEEVLSITNLFVKAVSTLINSFSLSFKVSRTNSFGSQEVILGLSVLAAFFHQCLSQFARLPFEQSAFFNQEHLMVQQEHDFEEEVSTAELFLVQDLLNRMDHSKFSFPALLFLFYFVLPFLVVSNHQKPSFINLLGQ